MGPQNQKPPKKPIRHASQPSKAATDELKEQTKNG